MNGQKPEALRLADELYEAAEDYYLFDKDTGYGAAAELRRLHEVNTELVGVLQEIRDNYDCDEDAHKYGSRCRSCVARAAITNAAGEQR
jgi:hypothetical protein